jgi:hypothetical protein
MKGRNDNQVYMKTEKYREGAEVRQEFEHTMTALFRAPKTTERKKPKKATKRKDKQTDKD